MAINTIKTTTPCKRSLCSFLRSFKCDSVLPPSINIAIVPTNKSELVSINIPVISRQESCLLKLYYTTTKLDIFSLIFELTGNENAQLSRLLSVCQTEEFWSDISMQSNTKLQIYLSSKKWQINIVFSIPRHTPSQWPYSMSMTATKSFATSILNYLSSLTFVVVSLTFQSYSL